MNIHRPVQLQPQVDRLYLCYWHQWTEFPSDEWRPGVFRFLGSLPPQWLCVRGDAPIGPVLILPVAETE